MGSTGTSTPYGRRLLHTTVDELAQTDPSRAWASIPYDDDDLSIGYQDIAYNVLANSVNKLAWFIETSLGPSAHFETIAYIGQPDVRYQMMSLAAAKTQYKVLFSSHMHSSVAHLALMAHTEATALFTAEGVQVADILASRPMRHFIIPELDDLVSAAPVKHYPYTKTFEQAAQDPYLILHSSGTTGMPKPIHWNHACTAALDARANLALVDPITTQQRRFTMEHPGKSRFFVPFTQFHAIASFVLPVACVFGGATYIPGFRRRLTTKDDIFNVLKHANISDAFMSPAMIEDIVRAPDVATYLSQIRTLLYGGAPMNQAAAETASKYTRLYSQWGMTELAKGVDFATSPADYDYCAFDTVSSGMRMEPLEGDDNLLHMFIDRTPTSCLYMPVFHRQPELQTFDTGDLWEPHPDPAKAPFTFRFRGRTDDLITYADGENVGLPQAILPTISHTSHLPSPHPKAQPLISSHFPHPI